VANHASARKRARQTIRITERNRHFRTATRSNVKRVRAAIANGDKAAATAALAQAVRSIDKAVAKGLWHRKAGSRYIARLTSQVHAL
jgi:small subunit ribosomal protein S20